MPRYRKLPPISRTPTPPPDFFRRLRPFSCNPFEPVEDDGQDRDDGDDEDVNVTPTNSTTYPFPLVKGVREPEKHYLPVGKDPAGRSKRQRVEKRPQIEEASPDIILENESVSEWDTLGSIFVAGGFLMMGNGFVEKGVYGEDEVSGEDDVGGEDEVGGEDVNLAGTGTEQAMNDTRPAVTASGTEGSSRGMGGEEVDNSESSETQTTVARPQKPGVQHSYNISPIAKGGLHTATSFELEQSLGVLDVDNCNTGRLIFSGPDSHDDDDTGPNDPKSTAPTTGPVEDDRDLGDTRKHAQLTARSSPGGKGKSVEKAISPTTTTETTINKQAVPPMVESVISSAALGSSGAWELPIGDAELKKEAEGDEWLKGLIFEILALPEHIAISIRGRDFFDSGNHKLCWNELKEKIDQGLGIGPNLHHSTVIVNWKFRLKTQADLDICIERLTPHRRPIHHVVVLFSSAGANAGVKVDEESITKEVVELLEARDRNYWMGKSVTPSATHLIPASKDSNADVVLGELPGEAQDSIRRSFGNPQQALPGPPTPLSENPTTRNPAQTSISHRLIPARPIAPKPPLWRTPNSPSTPRSKKKRTAAAGAQLHLPSPEQLSGQIMAPGNKPGNKTDDSSASSNGAPTLTATKWRSKPPARSSSLQASARSLHTPARGGDAQVQRNTRSNSKTTKSSLSAQPQNGSEAFKASDLPSSGAASAGVPTPSPKRRGSTGGLSRAKKRLAKPTNSTNNPQAPNFHKQSSTNASSASMGPPPKGQASMATSSTLATVCGLAEDGPLKPSPVNDAMDMDLASPAAGGAEDSTQSTEPNDLSISEGSAMGKANTGNTIYAMDEVDILLNAVMEVYNSAEKQPIPPPMKSLTLSTDRPEEGDTANRRNAPVALADTTPPRVSKRTEGGISAYGSKGFIAKPNSLEVSAGPLPDHSPAPVAGESSAGIRTDNGFEPITTTKPQPSTLKASQGGNVITEKKSLIVKLKSKGIAVLLSAITGIDATNRLHDTSDQASGQTSDHYSNQSKPKPICPAPPPPLSASPSATKGQPAPRPPTYHKPDPPVLKPAENAKATVNDKPQTPEQAIPAITSSPKAGSSSKKQSPESSGSLVASSDALAAEQKKVEQEVSLKSKAKKPPCDIPPTPMPPPKHQDARPQSPRSQLPETSSARSPPRPLTPAPSAQIAVPKPAPRARPTPSSNTNAKITCGTGITKSSRNRGGTLPSHAVPRLFDKPAPTPSVPATPKNMDGSRWTYERRKDATVNAVALLPSHKASKSATEEPCPKFTPLVSKSNFLYFEPPAVRKSPGDPHEKQLPTQDLAPLSDSPSTSSSNTKPKPECMVFTVTRYKNNNSTAPPHCAEFYGHEILSTSGSNKFSWEKLREILESRHKFVDFKECLVINLFHVVEGEKDLNEGLNLGVYLRTNKVLIVKVDPLGRLPPPLVAEMKAARLAVRKTGREME